MIAAARSASLTSSITGAAAGFVQPVEGTLPLQPSLAPPESERVAQLKALIGSVDRGLSPFPDAIRDVVFAKYDQYVTPLFAKHWPEALVGSTKKKLRFLACNLYATAPYTVLFAAERPPRAVRVARQLGLAFALSPRAVARVSGVAVKALAHLLDEGVQRRIVQIASFIATIDHVMDKCMDGVPPTGRAARMRGCLDGSYVPTSDTPHAGAFLFLKALKDEMGANIDNIDDVNAYARALARIDEFLDAEVNAMTGVKDPSGLSWRMPGILGTIDGLIFPVHRYAGEQARAWMYDVSLFVQVMDDYIDLDKDALDVRETPCLTGAWTFASVEAAWKKTVDGVVALAQQGGVDDEAYLAFVRDTYIMMTREVMDAMCQGSAA